jgi:hypothetical protein
MLLVRSMRDVQKGIHAKEDLVFSALSGVSGSIL